MRVLIRSYGSAATNIHRVVVKQWKASMPRCDATQQHPLKTWLDQASQTMDIPHQSSERAEHINASPFVSAKV